MNLALIICFLYTLSLVKARNLFFFENVAESTLNITKKCAEQLEIFGATIGGGSGDPLWAYKMIDATSKLQSGILAGNTGDMGHFDECIAIMGNTTVGDIRGKYCLGKLSFKGTDLVEKQLLDLETGLLILERSGVDLGENQLQLTWSSCFLSGCTAQDTSVIFSNLMEEYLQGAIKVEFTEDMCQTHDDIYKELPKGTIIAILVFSIIGAIVVLSTVYDIYITFCAKSEPLHLILVSFSVYSNGNKLFAVNHNPNQLECLNGLRVISMMWVVVGHYFSSIAFGTPYNGLAIAEWMDSLHSMYIVGATVSVDTFFFLSGLLMVYGFLQAMSKGVRFNVPLYWFHRYLRLTPALAAAILFETTITPYLASGPIWPMASDVITTNCKSYWWSSLIYLQNYINPNEMCMGQTWYLSVDMQLFILSPILLIPLGKWKKRALVWIFFLILLSIAVPFGVAWGYDLRSQLSADPNPAGDFQKLYYVATHTRAAPWLIGALMGYLIYQVKQRQVIKINKILVVILWAGSLSVLITCVYGGHSTLRVPEYDKWAHVSYLTFVRPSWAIALSWLTFACVTGYGGPINWFLSFSTFQVLGRLAYSVYLLHSTFLYISAINRSRLPVYFSDWEIIYLSWGTMVFTGALAIVWVLAFESPFIIIEKVLLQRGPTKTEKRTEDKEDTRVGEENVESGSSKAPET